MLISTSSIYLSHAWAKEGPGARQVSQFRALHPLPSSIWELAPSPMGSTSNWKYSEAFIKLLARKPASVRQGCHTTANTSGHQQAQGPGTTRPSHISWSKSLLLPEPLLSTTLNINITALNVTQYDIKSLAEG